MSGGSLSSNYIFVSSIASKIILIAGGIVLARVLPVEDFGYLLTLNIIFGFISLFSISGYEFYFIQNSDYSGNEELILLRQVFNLRIIQSILLFVVTNIVAFYQYIYGDRILGLLLAIASLLFLIKLISKPEESLLSKRLNYKAMSISGILRDFLSSFSKIICALLGLGAISFGIGNVIGDFFYSIYIKYKHNLNLLKKVGMKQSIEPYTKIRKFGFHLFLNTAGSFLTKQVDKIFVASFFDKEEQGYYQFAGNYASYPFNTLIAPQNNMVLSLMSKNKDKKEYLMELFNKFGIVSGLVIIPFFYLFFYFCPEIINILVGEKWLATVVLFRVFLIYYVIKVVFYPTNGILTSFGKPDTKAKVTITTFVVSLPLLLFVSYSDLGITYYAGLFIILSSLSDIICTILGFKLLQKSFFEFFLSRFKYLYPIVFLALVLFLFDQYFVLGDLWKTVAAFSLTSLTIYISIVFHSKIFLNALRVFIKNEKINRIFAYILFK